ncbi:XdhC family protein [Shewanella maritima]|uniref:XdhC family protein n=1 Tax=Shewanella maritima TaxID=2520507 RepID=UPI003735B25F
MTHHLSDILDAWLPSYQDNWVLAIITQVSGSSYRKPGAMMLFHPMGKSLGMLSGGCLEGDLRRHAQRVIQTQQTCHITYDATDESDTSYQLGCGGIVQIMMVSLTKANQYLGLLQLHDALNSGQSCSYQIDVQQKIIDCDSCSAQVEVIKQALQNRAFISKAKLIKNNHNDAAILSVPIRAPIHIGIFGGGLDAIPVSEMAQQLGWRVTVFDERSAYARQYDFVGAQINKQPVEQAMSEQMSELHAAIVMTHNLDMDARAIKVLFAYPMQYVALLGPGHRKDKVLTKAELSDSDFSGYFSAPAGLAIGGELPSSIALSILSQCHSVLFQGHQVLQQGDCVSLDKVMS